MVSEKSERASEACKSLREEQMREDGSRPFSFCFELISYRLNYDERSLFYI